MNTRSKHLPLQRLRLGVLAYCLGFAIAAPASADAVVDWNATFDQVAPAIGAPPQWVRLGAMTHIAIHDALNAIDPRYETYSVVPTANANASPDAAIAAAAHGVLISELSRPPETPAKAAARAQVQAAYITALAGIDNGPAKNDGIAAGRAAAEAIIALRIDDGSATPNLPYTLAPAPGVHQPTPPALVPPMLGGWGQVRPFAMTSPSQFRPGRSPLFNLRGLVYTLNYLEVKYLGAASVRAAAPDSERSRIARYWPGGGGNGNAMTRAIVAGRSLDRWQHARLFALLNMANADAAISTFDAKYHYNFWRPANAIRWANDGNPFTTPDPGWMSYQATPPYPDYPCGLTTNTGSSTGILRRYFGTDHVSYTLAVTIPQPPPLPAEILTRSYVTLSQAAIESVDARVFGGMHFRSACADGLRQGEKASRLVFKHYLRPLKK